jgi:hypothetical protein
VVKTDKRSLRRVRAKSSVVGGGVVACFARALRPDEAMQVKPAARCAANGGVLGR